MLALEKYKNEKLCPLCGMPKEVCQAPYGTYVYSAGDPIRCHVTTAIRQRQKDDGETPHPDALIYPPRVVPWGMATSD